MLPSFVYKFTQAFRGPALFHGIGPTERSLGFLVDYGGGFVGLFFD